MGVELTRAFAFSCSYTAGERALGRNYTLSVTVAAPAEAREAELEAAVRKNLVDDLHTRDLSQVGWLAGIEISDVALLRAFWKRLSGPLASFEAKRLALQRDSRTVTTLHLQG